MLEELHQNRPASLAASRVNSGQEGRGIKGLPFSVCQATGHTSMQTDPKACLHSSISSLPLPDTSSCALCSAFEVTLLFACSPSHSLSLESCCCHHTPIRLLLSTVRFHAVSPNCHTRFWFKHLFLPLPGKSLQACCFLSEWQEG